MTTPPAAVDSCRYCLAWGLIVGNGMCRECFNWRVWRRQQCPGCHRDVPLKHGYCRLCHQQVLRQLGRMVIRETMPEVAIDAWQLFLTFPLGTRRARGRPRKPPRIAADPVTWQTPGTAGAVPGPPRLSAIHPTRHANPHNPTLIQARQAARRLAEARGWAWWILREIDDGLLVVLSSHAPGDTITYSDLVPIDQLGHNVAHTAEVLALLGILDDDRVPTFDAWMHRKLAQLNPTLAADIELWATTLRDGGRRTRPRATDTIRNYLDAALPTLVEWSRRYQHLREVTRDDVKAAVSGLTGLKRKRALVGLRSIFGFHKKAGRLFRDPTTHFKTGDAGSALPAPLRPEQLDALVRHATTPLRRILLCLTAIHAARPTTLRELTLDDAALPDRRITISGHTRRIDDLTAQAITDYLRYRRERWPHTGNAHLLISEHTAQNDKPVSVHWLGDQFREVGVTLNQIRMDRQLEEALTHGPDPLHLTAVFGISERAAIRYANAAKTFLENGPRARPIAEPARPTTAPKSTNSRPRPQVFALRTRKFVPKLLQKSRTCGRDVDNGSAFVDAWLLRACAKLGVRLVHSTPGRPQGRGKIERLFRTVRDQFLVEVPDTTAEEIAESGMDHRSALLELNGLFAAWVEIEYHRRVHSETGQTPLSRWEAGWDRRNQSPVIPTAPDLTEAFLWSEYRTVTKTGTVSLHSNTYAVDPALAGRRVELVFCPFDMETIDVRHRDKSYGKALPHTITRHAHPKARPEIPAPAPRPSTGIDYLKLTADAHHEQLRRDQRIGYDALYRAGTDASEAQA